LDDLEQARSICGEPGIGGEDVDKHTTHGQEETGHEALEESLADGRLVLDGTSVDPGPGGLFEREHLR
jgi:hypothetical protein